MPISSQCLFRSDGEPYDILERELKREQWLYDHENILDVLFIEDNLRRRHLSSLEIDEESPFDETWTEADYRYYYGD